MSNVEFGKVERTLSKKLNSTVVVVSKSKSKPGYVYRLTVRMETSVCVADAANWGNIELAGTNPTYRPLPHRCESHITSHSRICHRLAGHCWAPRSASRCPSATPQYVCLHGSTPNIGWSGVTDVDLKCRIRRTPVRSTSPQEKDKYGRQRLRRAVAPRSCCGVHAVSSLLGRDYDVSSTTDNTGDGFWCPPPQSWRCLLISSVVTPFLPGLPRGV